MLAEIFMVQLEARARLASEPVRLAGGRFVPFIHGNRVAFKEQAMRLSRSRSCPMAAASPEAIERPTY
jgi:hypothetical protein